MKSFKEFLENLTEEQKTQIINDAILSQENLMINSERKELTERLNQALKEQANIKYSVLSFVTAIINRADYLSTEQKKELLESIWKGEDNE
jgi:hypothetical protein